MSISLTSEWLQNMVETVTSDLGTAVHTGTRANGTREFLSLGYLWNWSFAGLRVATLNYWLGGGYWYVSARPSLTGRRGSVVDWASSMGVNLAA